MLSWDVYDGDTVHVVLSGTLSVMGIEISVSVPMTARIAGVDTPELRDARQRDAGQRAKDFVLAWFVARDQREIQFEFVARDKYAKRVVGDFICHGRRLSRELVRKGCAKPYDGGTKEPWTDEELERIAGL